MSALQYQALTNSELARVAYTTGTANMSRDELEHLALRYIELFHSTELLRVTADLCQQITSVPSVVR